GSRLIRELTVPKVSSAETNCKQWEELRRWNISRVFVICTESASCHNKGKDRPSSAIKALRWGHSRESRRRRDVFRYSMTTVCTLRLSERSSSQITTNWHFCTGARGFRSED